MNRLRHIYTILIALGLALTSKAQDGLTLEKAFEIASKNHPGLKTAILKVEKEKALLKSNFAMENTNFSYSFGQINSGMIDYSININQSFKFPSFNAKKRLLEAKVAVGESNLQIAKSELKRAIRLEFILIQNLDQQLSLYQEQEALFNTMLEIIDTKMKVGETNILERNIADSKFQEAQIMRKKAEIDIISHTTNLSLLLFSKVQPITIAVDQSLELPLIDTTKMNSNPLLDYYQKSITIKERMVTIEKKGFLPNFNAGYFNQQIDGTQGFQGVQLGVSIPIFNRNQKAYVKASKIDVDISNQEMANYKNALHQLFQKQIQNYNKSYLEVKYYESKGEALANQVSTFATTAYQKGEIGYIEYIQSLNRAKQIRIGYLESLVNYNSEIIEILYLTGQ